MAIEQVPLKRLALHEVHVGMGAKICPFAGYEMPVQYQGINAEHQTVRNAVGVFDVSHMGEFLLKGSGALELIRRLCTNDAAALSEGKVQYTCMINETGGIVDDLLVYRLDKETYMLVVNASNRQKDWDWISAHNFFGVEIEDISDQTTLLAVQGPKAPEALQSLTNIQLSLMPYYTAVRAKMAGVDDVLISATGYTGAGGFELYIRNEYAQQFWDAVFKAGEPFGIQPIGLGARDTLRLEMGYCLYGNDLDDTTSPLEAGLGWIVKPPLTYPVSRKMVGFEVLERGIPRPGYPILDAEGQTIGRVTSGTQSPTLGKGIGMGYVQTRAASEGTEIFIRIRDQKIKARVVRPPFK